MSKAILSRFPFIPPALSIDHLIVGAGVVGLACAEKLLQSFPSKTTFVIERNESIGMETSSRNSEVIHGGLHYPKGSLKMNLCIRSRELLYQRCISSNIPFNKCGKLTLATTPDQVDFLKSLSHKLKNENVPLQWLTTEEVLDMEPDIGSNCLAALLSPETGIIDSHALMENMSNFIDSSENGEVILGNRVVRVDQTKDGYVVQTITGDETSSVLTRVLINAAGLNSHIIHNQISARPVKLYFAKGNYFKYSGPGVSKVKHLLYPAPNANSGGLGTHLTLSLDGSIKFGPDVEWLSASEELDSWKNHLEVKEDRLKGDFLSAVQDYLPGVIAEGFSPDYAGIRPKLTAAGAKAADFSITHDSETPGYVALLGIESPGLTSSLGIAEYVEKILRKDVWGSGRGNKVSEPGPNHLDGWA